jgi:hypothetical protein
MARRLPVLILRSPASLPKQGEIDLIGDLHRPSDHNCSVRIRLVKGATHDFATLNARELVLRCAQEWLSDFLPPARWPDNSGKETPLAAALLGSDTSVR